MKHTKEEIVAALQVIKEECGNYGENECYSCPLYNTEQGCMVQLSRAPQYWDIVHVEPEKVWRAFK